MVERSPLLTAFSGHYVFDNFVRLFIIFVGITLALVCVKIGYSLIRTRERDRMWGTVSFGLIVVTPSINGIYRFGQPLVWPTTVTYLLGLLCGIAALYYRITLSPPWLQFRTARAERMTQREAERAREDAARDASRHREDQALASDRRREDDMLRGSRGREDDGPEGQPEA